MLESLQWYYQANNLFIHQKGPIIDSLKCINYQLGKNLRQLIKAILLNQNVQWQPSLIFSRD
jgi:hypothetical protein